LKHNALICGSPQVMPEHGHPGDEPPDKH